LKQTTIIDRFGSGKNVTQKMLDQKLVNLIIDETLPLTIVDKPSFIDLVKLGLPNTMSIMCSKTLRKHLMVRFTETKEKIIIQMGNAQNVATTTDCWSHGRKSYIGVTAHWINLDTLQSKSWLQSWFFRSSPNTWQGIPTRSLANQGQLG